MGKSVLVEQVLWNERIYSNISKDFKGAIKPVYGCAVILVYILITVRWQGVIAAC